MPATVAHMREATSIAATGQLVASFVQDAMIREFPTDPGVAKGGRTVLLGPRSRAQPWVLMPPSLAMIGP